MKATAVRLTPLTKIEDESKEIRCLTLKRAEQKQRKTTKNTYFVTTSYRAQMTHNELKN